MVNHYRRSWRQLDQARKPSLNPSKKTLIEFLRKFDESFSLFFTQSPVLITHHFQFRPSTGKVEPVRVLRVPGRNGCLQAVDQLTQATGLVFDGSGSNADTYPGLGQGVRMLVWNGVQQPRSLPCYGSARFVSSPTRSFNVIVLCASNSL